MKACTLYATRFGRWLACAMVLMIFLQRPALPFAFPENIWRMVQILLQETHEFFEKLVPHGSMAPLAAPVVPAHPVRIAPRHREARRPAPVVNPEVSEIRLHDSPSHLTYHLHLTGRLSQEQALFGGTLVSAEVQSGEEVVSAQTVTRPDGGYELDIPFYSHIYARVDWRLSARTPQGSSLESAGHNIVAREEQDIHIEVPGELQSFKIRKF